MAPLLHGRRLWPYGLALLLALLLLMPSLTPPAAAQISPSPTWTPLEQWAWAMIQAGGEVDFNAWLGPPAAGPDLDRLPADQSQRRLRASFLGDVLLRQPWRSGIGHHGVRIMGAVILEPLDLSGAELAKDLALEQCWLLGGFTADLARLDKGLSLAGSAVKEASLYYAEVKGRVALSKALAGGLVNLTGLRTGGTIYLDEGRFQAVRMQGAQVGGAVSTGGATRFGELLDMSNLTVNSHLWLSGCQLHGVKLDHAEIKGLLSLCGARFSSGGFIRLGGARAGGVLSLGLEDWPEAVELTRFAYGFIDCPRDGAQEERPREWKPGDLVSWLGRQGVYSQLPYEQCAKVLREAGQPGQANQVLFRGKARGMAEAWDRGEAVRAIWMLALLLFIGFGVGHYQLFAAFWVALLVGAGYGLLAAHERGLRRAGGESPGLTSGFWDRLTLSMDLIVPFLRLRDKRPEIDLTPRLGLWLFFIKAAALLLASFILAGLTGLIR